MDFFTAIIEQTENRATAIIHPTTLFSIMQKIGKLDAGSITKITITAA